MMIPDRIADRNKERERERADQSRTLQTTYYDQLEFPKYQKRKTREVASKTRKSNDSERCGNEKAGNMTCDK
jgi:hypothetical protein